MSLSKEDLNLGDHIYVRRLGGCPRMQDYIFHIQYIVF